MNPTLYDILGVRPDATPDEIKRAWRGAADRFEPGSGGSAQFRLFNEAAEVLLDPDRRREYDAQLAGPPAQASLADAERPDPDAEQPAPADAAQPDPGPADAAQPDSDPADAAEPARQDDSGTEVAGTEVSGAAGTEAAVSGAAGAGAPRWLMAALGAVALVLVAAVAWLGLNTWDVREVHAHRLVADAARTAPAAAERAAATILSYDYRSLDSDERAAKRSMTPGYARKYAQTFDRLVRGNAAKLKAHVAASVRASGVSHADPDRVNVLVFVDQTTVSTANSGQKQTALNRVEMKMVRRNGAWLVDDITSY